LPLIGFAISKKVLKSACKRNRAKRRVREAYRLVKNSFDDQFRQENAMHRWYALVWVINPGALTIGFQDIAAGIKDSLVKAGKKFGSK
jgi:ribonuclease P protein component